MPRRKKSNKQDFDDDISCSGSDISKSTNKSAKSIKSSKKSSRLGKINEDDENNNIDQDADDILIEALDLLDGNVAKKTKRGLELLLKGMRKDGSEIFILNNSESICHKAFRVLNKGGKEENLESACKILGLISLFEINDKESVFTEIFEKLAGIIDESAGLKSDRFSSIACLSISLVTLMLSPYEANNTIKLLRNAAIKSSKRSVKLAGNLNPKKAANVTSSAMETADVVDSTIVKSTLTNNCEKCSKALEGMALLSCCLNSFKSLQLLRQKTFQNEMLNFLTHESDVNIRMNAATVFAVLISKCRKSLASDLDGNEDEIDLKIILQNDNIAFEFENVINNYCNSNEKTIGGIDNRSLKSHFKKVRDSIFDNAFDDRPPINIGISKYQAETLQINCWEIELFYDFCKYYLQQGLLIHLQTNVNLRQTPILNLGLPQQTYGQDEEMDVEIATGLTRQELKNIEQTKLLNKRKIRQKERGKNRTKKHENVSCDFMDDDY